MSDIPKARALLNEIETMTDLVTIRRQVRRAIGLMIREPACRRAPEKRVVLDHKIKARIRWLARHTDLTEHQIAEEVGVRNTGRVSEVLNGKR